MANHKSNMVQSQVFYGGLQVIYGAIARILWYNCKLLLTNLRFCGNIQKI